MNRASLSTILFFLQIKHIDFVFYCKDFEESLEQKMRLSLDQYHTPELIRDLDGTQVEQVYQALCRTDINLASSH